MKSLAALNAAVADIKKKVEKNDIVSAANSKRIGAVEAKQESFEHVLTVWMELIDRKIGITNDLLFRADMRAQNQAVEPHPTPKL